MASAPSRRSSRYASRSSSSLAIWLSSAGLASSGCCTGSWRAISARSTPTQEIVRQIVLSRNRLLDDTKVFPLSLSNDEPEHQPVDQVQREPPDRRQQYPFEHHLVDQRKRE